jgi:hypothetical protein
MFIFTISKKKDSGEQLILFGRFRHRSVPTPPNANSENVTTNRGDIPVDKNITVDKRLLASTCRHFTQATAQQLSVQQEHSGKK